MSETPATYQAHHLPDDMARCAGVGDRDATGAVIWRACCQRCLRRLAPSRGDHTPHMEPPAVADECVLQIELWR